MAWSDAARAAALATRRAHMRKDIYSPGSANNSVHMSRKEMAANIKDIRQAERASGRGKTVRGFAAAKAATSFTGSFGKTKLYTSVKGAHFVDQGLKGTAWRGPGQRAAPRWSAKITKYYTR